MIFLICYAFGCELWAPWSEELGRRWTLQASLFLVNSKYPQTLSVPLVVDCQNVKRKLTNRSGRSLPPSLRTLEQLSSHELSEVFRLQGVVLPSVWSPISMIRTNSSTLWRISYLPVSLVRSSDRSSDRSSKPISAGETLQLGYLSSLLMHLQGVDLLDSIDLRSRHSDPPSLYRPRNTNHHMPRSTREKAPSSRRIKRIRAQRTPNFQRTVQRQRDLTHLDQTVRDVCDGTDRLVLFAPLWVQ